MSTKRGRIIVLLTIVAIQFYSGSCMATPLPEVPKTTVKTTKESVVAAMEEAKGSQAVQPAPNLISSEGGGAVESGAPAEVVGSPWSGTAQETTSLAEGQFQPQPQPQPQPQSSRVEKLKRGLSSFVNKSNPATFFVPSAQQIGTLAGTKGTSASADSTSLINADPSSDAIIGKGPNRLAHTRPIGGPLRWGRR